MTRNAAMLRCVKRNLLTILMTIGVIIGIALGFILQYRVWVPREIMYLNFPGTMFLRMLNCLVLPLIISSIISAIGSIDLKRSRKLAILTVVNYFTTTVIAVMLGIAIVVGIQPGERTKHSFPDYGNTVKHTPTDAVLDLIRNSVPINIIGACIFQEQTVVHQFLNTTNITNEKPIEEWEITFESRTKTNTLGIICVSIMFGIALNINRTKEASLVLGFISLTKALMLITNWVVWLSPIGVVFLVASKLVEMEDFMDEANILSLYTASVLIGLFIHGVIILPALFFFTTRKEPFQFMLNMSQALATAWATSSSSATLPVTITCLIEKNHVDPEVVMFVVPIGAAINMDGNALYEAVATLFIAQIRNKPLNFVDIVLVSVIATVASMGASGTPQAGYATTVMVLNAIGLPEEDVTIIIVMDWILDRFRTTVNVLGDALGAGTVDFLIRQENLDVEEESIETDEDIPNILASYPLNQSDYPHDQSSASVQEHFGHFVD